jgi:type VI secretion system protein ImpJ
MKAPRRPVWSEGMLLSPQHLQALDRYHESLLAARVAGVAPQDWGVLQLTIDAAALAAGQLRVVQLAAILPDGLAVAFDEGDPDSPPPRAIAEHFPAAARSLDVWLAVARERDGVPSFADEASASRVRFAVASRPVEDATAPGQALAVSLGRPNAVVLLGGEPREDFEALKIAEVVRSAAGQPVLSETFVPPCLRLSASPFLMAGLRDLQTRILAKQRDLLGGAPRGQEMTGAEVSRLLQLLVLSTHAPVVAHLAETGDAPPREAYLELAALAGQVAALSGDPDPAAVPKFAHADLRSTFEPLLGRLRMILGGLAAAQHLVVPLEKRAGGLYLGRLTDEAVLRSQLFLAVQSELPEQQVADSIPRLCKIASTAEIQGLIQAAAPGMVLHWLPRPPPQLAPRQGTAYFAVATGDRYWQGVLSNRAIAIYVPPPFDPAKTGLELLAVPPAGAGAAPATGSAIPRPPDVKRL